MMCYDVMTWNGDCRSTTFRYDPKELSVEDGDVSSASAIKNLNFSRIAGSESSESMASNTPRGKGRIILLYCALWGTCRHAYSNRAVVALHLLIAGLYL